MSGFTKLFASITESSIWGEDDKTLRVWVCFLAKADSRGVVEGSVPGLAHLCRMTVDEFGRCIEKLESPDKWSRTPDNEGRRIRKVSGGWEVLNYLAYREKGQSMPGSRAAYMRGYRKQQSEAHDGNNVLQDVTRNTEAEAEAEADKKLGAKLPNAGGAEVSGGKRRSSAPDEAWIAALEADEAYNGLGVRREVAKCQRWCQEHGKAFSKRRIVNWLNRADPMPGSLGVAIPPPPKPLFVQIRELEAQIESHPGNWNRAGYVAGSASDDQKSEYKEMLAKLAAMRSGRES